MMTTITYNVMYRYGYAYGLDLLLRRLRETCDVHAQERQHVAVQGGSSHGAGPCFMTLGWRLFGRGPNGWNWCWFGLIVVAAHPTLLKPHHGWDPLCNICG